MATNKNAQLRYQALDRCLSNWYHKYYIEELIEASHNALEGITKKAEGVQKRQVQKDLNDIEFLYGLEIIPHKDGHRRYYRYANRGDSINNQPPIQEELEVVSNALTIMKRFEGIPQFEWLEDVEKQLYST